MHCGMCLPTCPTYDATHRERNSPRGRISLMRAVADGALEITPAFADEMSYCLGCLACQTACPAGVNYATLFETARNDIESAGADRSPRRQFWRAVTLGFLFKRPRDPSRCRPDAGIRAAEWLAVACPSQRAHASAARRYPRARAASASDCSQVLERSDCAARDSAGRITLSRGASHGLRSGSRVSRHQS